VGEIEYDEIQNGKIWMGRIGTRNTNAWTVGQTFDGEFVAVPEWCLRFLL